MCTYHMPYCIHTVHVYRIYLFAHTHIHTNLYLYVYTLCILHHTSCTIPYTLYYIYIGRADKSDRPYMIKTFQKIPNYFYPTGNTITTDNNTDNNNNNNNTILNNTTTSAATAITSPTAHTPPTTNIIPTTDLYTYYSNTYFCPVGQGHISYDCFRIYEAISAGCIPIVVGNYSVIINTFKCYMNSNNIIHSNTIHSNSNSSNATNNIHNNDNIYSNHTTTATTNTTNSTHNTNIDSIHKSSNSNIPWLVYTTWDEAHTAVVHMLGQPDVTAIRRLQRLGIEWWRVKKSELIEDIRIALL